MSENRSILWRVIGVVLLLGVLAGAGVLVYRAGVAQGLVQAPEMAEVFSSAVESGQMLPQTQFRGHFTGSYGMHPRMGYFPLGGIFGLLIFFFVVCGLIRMIFFRHRYFAPFHGRGPWRGYGPWGDPWMREEKDPEKSDVSGDK